MSPNELLSSALASLVAGGARFAPPAYLDPGSGSILLQILVAGILGGLFAVKAFWGRIKARLTRRPGDEEKGEGSE
jgi:hypothetical protein